MLFVQYISINSDKERLFSFRFLLWYRKDKILEGTEPEQRR